MKRNAFRLALLCAFFTLFAAILPAQKPLGLQIDGQAGEVITLRETRITETTVTVFGETQSNLNEIVSEYTYTIRKKLPDGNIDWDVTISAMKTRESSSGEDAPREYVSNDPNRDTNDVRTRMMDQLIGAPMSMQTDANGRIVWFKGADSLFAEMIKSIPEDMQPAMTNTMRQNFGDSALVQNMQGMWGDFYPEKPVRKNSRWSKTDLLRRGMAVSRTTEYTLKKRNKQSATIASVMSFTPLKGNAAALDFGAFKIAYQLGGSGKGVIVVDQPSGMLKRMDNFITLSGTMKIESANMPAVKDIPVTMKITTLVERL